MASSVVTQKIENQNKTPQEKAAEIIKAAFEDKAVLMSGTTFQKLETVTRYLNVKKISARGEAWFLKNFDSLSSDVLDLLVSTRDKQINDYLKKQEQAEKDEAFRDMVARGTSVPDAYAKVYTK